MSSAPPSARRTTTIVGCILAGGRSTRMGGQGDKFRQVLGDIPLIERIRRRLLPQVDQLIVNGRGADLDDLQLPVMTDTRPGAGPLAGVEVALDWVAATHGADATLLTVPADTPFLPLDLVARLSAPVKNGAATIATAASASGVHPAISLWPARLHAELSSWLEGTTSFAVNKFIATQRSVEVFFDGLVDPFFNINRPADLEEAEALLRAHPELDA